MNSGKKVNVAGKGTDLVHSSAVNTLALVQEPSSYNIFLELIQNSVEHCLSLSFGILVRKVLINLGGNLRHIFISHALIVRIERPLNAVDREILDSLKELGINDDVVVIKLRLADLACDVLDPRADLLDLLVRHHNSFKHRVFGHTVRSALDHINLFLCSGNG